MKIYEIGTGYTPIPAQVAAATESVVEELTRAFLRQGQPVEILDVSAADRADHDLPIREVWVPSAITRSDISLGIMHKVKRVAYSVALAGKLRKLLQKAPEKVVLHFHNQYNLFFFLKLVPEKLRTKALIAYTNHNGFWSLPWEEAEQTLRSRYFQEIEAMKHADLVFVLNEKMKENAVLHLGVPADRVIRVNNGVNTAVYTPLDPEAIAARKKDLGLDGKKVILQVGSINENKGQGRSVELLAPLLKARKDLVFAYAGGVVSEEYHQQLQQTARDLGVADQVVYLGMVSPGREMNSLYNLAQATIFASNYEASPLVCIEALSAGVPVLLSTAMPLDFGPGSICLAPETALQTIEALLDDETALGSLKEKARSSSEQNFTWDRIARDYRTAMEQAM